MICGYFDPSEAATPAIRDLFFNVLHRSTCRVFVRLKFRSCAATVRRSFHFVSLFNDSSAFVADQAHTFGTNCILYKTCSTLAACQFFFSATKKNTTDVRLENKSVLVSKNACLKVTFERSTRLRTNNPEPERMGRRGRNMSN